jgi:hypothetical protein
MQIKEYKPQLTFTLPRKVSYAFDTVIWASLDPGDDLGTLRRSIPKMPHFEQTRPEAFSYGWFDLNFRLRTLR